MSGPRDFDWLDDDSIAVREQSAIAVYQNRWGHLVIRQEADPYEAEDAIINVAPQNVAALVEVILRTAGLEPPPQLLLPSPAQDRTAAERQKRYRDKHRNAARDALRHDRNGVTLRDAPQPITEEDLIKRAS